MEQAWVVEIREQCLAASVPFFFKQWGGTNKKKAGRLLNGRTWEGVPATVVAPRPAARFV
jgi:protein gp37